MIFNEKYPVNLQAINNTLRMARIGYLWNTPHYKFLEEDKQWMLNNGCEQIIEEQNIHEKLKAFSHSKESAVQNENKGDYPTPSASLPHG